MATLSTHQNPQEVNFRSLDDSISSAAYKRNLSIATETEDEDYSGSESGDDSGSGMDIYSFDLPPECLKDITSIPFSFVLSSIAESQAGSGSMRQIAQNIDDDRLQASFGVPVPDEGSTLQKTDVNIGAAAQVDIEEDKGNAGMLRCSHCAGTGLMTSEAIKEEKNILRTQLARETAYKNQAKDLQTAYNNLENEMSVKLVKVLSACKLAHGGGDLCDFDLDNFEVQNDSCSDEESTGNESCSSESVIAKTEHSAAVALPETTPHGMKQKPNEANTVLSPPAVIMEPFRKTYQEGLCTKMFAKTTLDAVKKTMSTNVNFHRRK